ncbi:MAG: hypothetical protein N4A31_00565 [Rickettsiales bacterium]|jgi:hypothetical protein|nr:hypothetical protein [Rickettsiales bacterium]
MKIKSSRTTIIAAIVLAAVFLTYFSTETSYEVQEVTKEVKLVGVKKKSKS